jgi:hypothetical protein
MMLTTEELTPAMTAIFKQIGELPQHERLRIGHLVLDLELGEDEFEPVTVDELIRRSEQMNSGNGRGTPWEEVKRKMKEKYG